MLKAPVFFIISAAVLPLFVYSAPEDKSWKQPAPAASVFIENKGQMLDMEGKPVPFVLFKKESNGLNLYITEKGLTYVFVKTRKEPKTILTAAELEEEQRTGKKKMNKFFDWSRIDMELKEASIKRENVVAEEASTNISQYFLGHCPDGIKDVHGYGKITIKNIYPGIDWVFYNSTEKGVKYDFVVHPGADPEKIKLIYRSKENLDLDANGNINIQTSYGNLTERAPVSYIRETNENIPTQFVKAKVNSWYPAGNDEGFEAEVVFSFKPSTLNLERSTLVIDPQLYWATFFGGSGYDGPRCVETDNANNVYVTGYTESTDFPTLNGGGFFQGTAGGGVRDMFLQKFSNTGVRLWATYYGGSLSDEGWSIAIDNTDNVFIFGYTESSNFPTLNAGTFFQGTYGGQGDAIILKFNSAGVRQWATYYGGANMEEGFGITVDASGNIFMTGETRSTTTFPLLNPGGGAFYQGTFGTGTSDAFVLKFDNAGNRLWSTYAGGWNTDMGTAITADLNGNIFVTGWAGGGGFPVLNAGTYSQGYVNATDAFIMKFSNAGVLLWSTYYGGGANDEGGSLVTDASGNLFVTGNTAATNFPTLNPGGGAYFQGTKNGTWDTYLLKFDNLGNRLWATYFGGSGFEAYKEYTLDNLAIDDCGNVYMSVETGSTDVPTLQSCDNGFYNSAYNGGSYDMFITQFSNAGVYRWGTYFGGDGDDFRTPIAIDKDNSLFVSGEWTDGSPINPATYPLTNPGGGSYNNTFTGGHDGLMAKFTKTVPTLSVTPVNATCGCTGSATANPGGICSPFTYTWSNGQTTQTATGLCAGTYSVTVANSLCGTTANNTVTITSSGGFTLTPTVSPAACIAANGSATITPTGGQTPFTYAWSPSGGTNATATGLAAGNYTVTVTDANGCTGTVTVSITTSGSFTTTTSSTPSTCLSSNGSATVTPTGGQTPFTYAWSPSGGTNATATGLSSGNYTVSITDANGCTGTVPITITSTGGPILSLSNQTNVSCNGGMNGTATMTASSGTSPYTFIWSPSGGTTSAATGLGAGTYTTTVTDANGCIQTQTVTITEPTALTTTISSTPASCGNANGTASVSVGGGSPGYSYSWSGGGTTAQISNLTSQIYSVTITDGNGCITTNTVSVSTTGSVTATANNATICSGQTATLNASGGTNYSWNTGATTSSVTVAPLVGTNYTVIVSSGGCADTAVVSVSVLAIPNPPITGITTICTGQTTTLSTTGGPPTTYLWSTGSTATSIAVSPTVNTGYTLTITTVNGCSAYSSVTVTLTSAPVASAAGSTLCAGESTMISATGGGTYSWSNGSTTNPLLVSPSTSTTYSVIVSIGACSDTASATVTVNPLPVASAANDTTILLGHSTTLSASGGGTYSWSTGATTSVITVSPVITSMYCVFVTDANGCTDSACVTVFIEPTNCSAVSTEEAFVLPSAFSPNGDGENEWWRLLYAPQLIDCIAEYYIAVYSRWGEKVFEGTSIMDIWNGTYNGKLENTAVFAYYLEAVMKDGTKIKKKGNVSLLR